MRHAYLASAVLVAVLWIGSVSVAQTPATQPEELKLAPIPAAWGAGVTNAQLIDRPEVRVLRVDMAANGVRNVHAHDEMQYHLFIPTSAGMRLEPEGQAPIDVPGWQVQFIKGGTRHGFRNMGTSTVSVLEVFVRK
ncbi:MAG TPA: hypothetical protein VJM31_11425 [Vicinamibacterales bacterium]|nr:hypothetical protein [Vicinamibacterales bacterium]